MATLFRSKKLEIEGDGEHAVHILVKCHKLANKLNRALGFYYKDVTIRAGDEPIFRISKHDLGRVLKGGLGKGAPQGRSFKI